MKEEHPLLLSDLQKLVNQVVFIDYIIIILGVGSMAIKSIDILNVLIFQRQWRIDNGDCKTSNINTGDTISDGFHLEFGDGINRCV